MGNTLLGGQIALVTGASRGIGAAISTALAAEGASVILIARSESRLRHISRSTKIHGSFYCINIQIKHL